MANLRLYTNNTKRVIIFDLDGVIFDSVKLAEKSFLENFPTMTSNDHKEILTGNFHEEMEKFKNHHTGTFRTEEEKEERKIKYAQEKLKVNMYEGVFNLLKNLKEKGYLLIINTSAMNRNCIPLLEKSGIQNIFDWVATGEISKNKIEKFNIIRDRYHLKNKDMIFITDTLGDVREANISDIPTVAVLWGAHDISFFNREKNKNLIAIVESPLELEKFIYNYFDK